MNQYNAVARAWLLTLNNPANHGYPDCPRAACEQLRTEWCSKHPLRSGIWMYCISSNGSHHIHMILTNRAPVRRRLIAMSVPADTIQPFSSSRNLEADIERYIRVIDSIETIVTIVR